MAEVKQIWCEEDRKFYPEIKEENGRTYKLDPKTFVYLEQVELGLTDEEQQLLSEPIDRWGKAWQKFMTENYPEEIPSLEGRLKWELIPRQIDKEASLTFEQLGFDSIVVDEAHNYKNGLVVSKMNRVSGVQTTPAQKSEDILMKTQYLNENYGEKNIIFATGTPVSNSMTELYIMQRYLRPSLLRNAGLQTFDDWASNFGEVVSKAELKPAGNGYRTNCLLLLPVSMVATVLERTTVMLSFLREHLRGE